MKFSRKDKWGKVPELRCRFEQRTEETYYGTTAVDSNKKPRLSAADFAATQPSNIRWLKGHLHEQ
jgi:hypothetical protein